jgi:hypothetical protein
VSFIVFGIISIIVCWKWGNWRKWKEYYPTILYFILGNTIYIILTNMKPLWNFGEISKYPICDIVFMLSLYPSSTILFLTLYPKSKSINKQALYIIFWDGLFCLLEYLAYLTGGFGYSNGWNIYYSMAFNLFMFTLLRLHYIRPLYVWPISAILAFVILFLFHIPIEK